MIHAKEAEFPSWHQFPPFMMGQDQQGNWVVQDKNESAAAYLLIATLRSDTFGPRMGVERRPSS